MFKILNALFFYLYSRLNLASTAVLDSRRNSTGVDYYGENHYNACNLTGARVPMTPCWFSTWSFYSIFQIFDELRSKEISILTGFLGIFLPGQNFEQRISPGNRMFSPIDRAPKYLWFATRFFLTFSVHFFLLNFYRTRPHSCIFTGYTTYWIFFHR